MCGRYLFFDERNPIIEAWINLAKDKLPEETFQKLSLFEVFPSQEVLTFIYDHQLNQMGLKIQQWGFPMDKNRIINIRSESFLEKKMFENTYSCIIPASGYYEWDTQRNKYYFKTKDDVIYLAALGKEINGIPFFAILTEEASEPEIQIHHRQPILLTKEDALSWCKSNKHEFPIKEKSIHDRIMNRVSS